MTGSTPAAGPAGRFPDQPACLLARAARQVRARHLHQAPRVVSLLPPRPGPADRRLPGRQPGSGGGSYRAHRHSSPSGRVRTRLAGADRGGPPRRRHLVPDRRRDGCQQAADRAETSRRPVPPPSSIRSGHARARYGTCGIRGTTSRSDPGSARVRAAVPAGDTEPGPSGPAAPTGGRSPDAAAQAAASACHLRVDDLALAPPDLWAPTAAGRRPRRSLPQVSPRAAMRSRRQPTTPNPALGMCSSAASALAWFVPPGAGNGAAVAGSRSSTLAMRSR